MGLDSETVIRELGGGAAAILVVLLLLGLGTLSLVIRAMWAKVNALQERIFDIQQGCNDDSRKREDATNAALGAVNTSLAALVAAMRERGRGRED